MGKNGEFILWGIGKTDWEIPHFSPLVPPHRHCHNNLGSSDPTTVGTIWSCGCHARSWIYLFVNIVKMLSCYEFLCLDSGHHVLGGGGGGGGGVNLILPHSGSQKRQNWDEVK